MIKNLPLNLKTNYYTLIISRNLKGKILGLIIMTLSQIYFAQNIYAQDGFVSIFNGENLKGWHISKTNHHGTTGNFFVEDGAIIIKQYPYGQGGIILSDNKYQDFELSLEFKGHPGTNGGIFLRSSESGSAYQLELAGDGENGTGNLFGEMLRTTINAKVENIEEVWKKGDWNQIRIRLTGEVPKASLWINGVHLWDAEGKRNDLIGDAKEGMIAFQLHWSATLLPVPGGSCCDFSWKPDAAHAFRNIVIRELKPTF